MTLALNIEESDSGDGFPDRGQLQKCVEDEWGNIVTCLSVEKLQSIDLIDETIRVHFILKLLKLKHDAALVVVKTGKRLDPEFTYARKEIKRNEGSVDFDIPSIMEEFEEGGEVDIHLVSKGKIIDLNQLSMTIHIGPEVPGVPSPRQILMEFYDATKGKSWKNNNGWLDDEIDVCDWYGISCYNGNIRKIKLVVNKLEGTLPESIGYISTLEHLILSDNKLKGSLPESLGDLNRLKDLSIFMNDLSGSLPESLGNLVKLKEISLFKNKLNGSLPDSLGKLTNLQALNLSGNKLTGPLPESVGGLSSMETLNLFDNKINGALPESFGKLVQLEFLYIYQNKLTGNISTTLCNGNKIEFWVDGSDISCHCCRQMGLK